MKKNTLASLLIFLLSISSVLGQTAGENKGWPSEERYSFIKECIKSAKVGMSVDSARFYCYCMQEKMEARFPKIEDAGKITSEELATAEWKTQIKACLVGFWSDRDRDEFLSNCIKTAKENIGEEKAKNYCGCMLFKMEQKYPSIADTEKITKEVLNSPEWKKLIDGCLKF